jgi:lysozyme
MSDEFGKEILSATLDDSDKIALPLIKKWEGLHRVGKDGLIYPYRDPAGYPTIGYGTLVPSMTVGPITEEYAFLLLYIKYAQAKAYALMESPILARYPKRLAAISSFVYNLGIGRYRSSTLRTKVNAGNWVEAKYQIQRWVYAGGRKLNGLVARRKEEAELL